MKNLPGRLVLLGHPVSHSRSPTFQNAALAAAGIPVRYEAIDVDPGQFGEAVAMIRRERAAGNVTVPHKERMHDACDELTPLAERVGAVNTFYVDTNDQLVGDNTDVGGFDFAVRALLGTAPRDLTVGVVGAGGSAAAVLAAVERWPGSTAHVYNRTPERARTLSERFRAVSQPVDDIEVIAGAHLVVNATTLGLRDPQFPVDPALLAPGTAVIDLVYRPGETAWVRAARDRGHRACDGGPMLVEQGAIAFEIWFGIAPDRSIMWEAFSAP
ncbi:MAG: shikimate dehydrogenase [Gemmatimonadaceae bacterium]